MTENEKVKIWNEVIDTVITSTREHDKEYITADSSTCNHLIEIFREMKRAVLDSCPCCGFEAKFSTETPDGGFTKTYKIKCTNRNCNLQTASYTNKDAPINTWNKRLNNVEL
jgi:hypothetical protein